MNFNKECTIDPLLIAEFDKVYIEQKNKASNCEEISAIKDMYQIGQGAINHDNEECLIEIIKKLKSNK